MFFLYFTQVALIAYLAHTGSYVPADRAKISILDQIHTRIQTTESVASQLSAFLIDLRQVINMIIVNFFDMIFFLYLEIKE